MAGAAEESAAGEQARRLVVLESKQRVTPSWLRIDSHRVRHSDASGRMLPERVWEVVERGDSVAIVLFRRDTEELVLTRQFRAPLLNRGASEAEPERGWMVELVAGSVKLDGSETPEQTIIRETREEVGYAIAEPEPISVFYPSPGACSERIFLFYAEVTEADRIEAGGGVETASEAIEPLHWPAAAFFAWVAERRNERRDPTSGRTLEPVDGKILAAEALLKERLGSKAIAARPGPAKADRRARFALRARPDTAVIVRAGAIREVRDVDIWVNSENTGMEMAQVFDATISGTIRRLGAFRDRDGAMIEDTIALALHDARRLHDAVEIGTVLDTTSGALRRSHGVARILHVAGVRPTAEAGVATTPEQIARAAEAVILEAERLERSFFLGLGSRSILLPMVGSGRGGQPPLRAIPALVTGVLRALAARARPRLREVHLLGYTEDDVVLLLDQLRSRSDALVETAVERAAR